MKHPEQWPRTPGNFYFDEDPDYPAALAEALATAGLPRDAFDNLMFIGGGPNHWPMDSLFLTELAAITTLHSSLVHATGAQRTRARRLLARQRRRGDVKSRRERAACTAAGGCQGCWRAPTSYQCERCNGTRRA